MTSRLKAAIKVGNEKALEEFIITLGSVRRYLEIIESAAEDHLGFDPDEINWGHVGNAESLLNRLRAAAETFNVDEYI